MGPRAAQTPPESRWGRERPQTPASCVGFESTVRAGPNPRSPRWGRERPHGKPSLLRRLESMVRAATNPGRLRPVVTMGSRAAPNPSLLRRLESTMRPRRAVHDGVASGTNPSTGCVGLNPRCADEITARGRPYARRRGSSTSNTRAGGSITSPYVVPPGVVGSMFRCAEGDEKVHTNPAFSS